MDEVSLSAVYADACPTNLERHWLSGPTFGGFSILPSGGKQERALTHCPVKGLSFFGQKREDGNIRGFQMERFVE